MMSAYSRRDFVKTLGLGAAALALPGRMSISRLHAGQNKRPNIQERQERMPVKDGLI